MDVGRAHVVLASVVLATAFASCGDNACQEAVAKLSQCMSTLGRQTTAAYSGDCDDRVRMVGTDENGNTVTRTVAFKSWAEKYAECSVDPTTCLCPGLPSYADLPSVE